MKTPARRTKPVSITSYIDDRYYDIGGEVIPNRHHGPLTDEAVVQRLEACVYGKVEAV